MKRNLLTATMAFAIAAGFGTIDRVHAATPGIMNYQGRVQVNAVDFNGSGQFKFALVNPGGTVTYWSNDLSSTTANEPAASVSLNVTKGLFSVLLGDASITNMSAIPLAVFNNSDVRLRIWFNDGANGFQLLTPDERISAVGYAIIAANAESVVDGAVTTFKIFDGAVTYAKLQNTSGNALLLGRGSVGSGPPQEIALGTNLSITGTTLNSTNPGGNVVGPATPVTHNFAAFTDSTGKLLEDSGKNASSFEVPLTFNTGLTRTTNTITVNTSQNILILSNLTTNGFVKATGGNGTLSVDTNTYLTGNQSITLSGDVTGSGVTSINATLANGAVTNAKIVSVDYSKVTNAPAALPPNGAASGDLSGTYPNPSIKNTAGNNITTAINDVATTTPILDSKLATIATPGKVSDSALSSNVALLGGRAGGQSLRGGTAPSESLTLESTTDAAKGNIILNPTGGNVGIGVTPGQKLTVAGIVESTSGGYKFPDGTIQTTAASSVPSGFLILGDSPSPPTGYTALGTSIELPWVAKANMPTGRSGLTNSGAVVNNKIYVIGGDGYLTNNEEYTPATNTWLPKAPMPTNRVRCAGAAVNGIIYMMGGLNNPANIIAVNEAYDPAQDTWSAKAPMPTARESFFVCTVNSKIYAIGGEVVSGSATNVCEEYTPVSNTWLSKTPMPLPRLEGASCVFNNKIYVFGGTDNSGAYLDRVEIYDPSTDTWVVGAPMPTPRKGVAACLLNGKIYVFGGAVPNNNPVDNNEEYDPVSNTWAVRLRMLSKRSYLFAGVVNGMAYAIGDGTANEVYGAQIFYLYRKN